MTQSVILETPTALIRGSVTRAPGGAGRPMVVALHGGGFTSRYFQAPGFSLAAALTARDLDVVLLDRPGYGDSSLREAPSETLQANAEALREAIGALWKQADGRNAGVVLIGHSIGGAIALMIAAGETDWSLVGVLVAGIGDRPPAGLALPPAAPGERFALPRDVARSLFFGTAAIDEAAVDAMMDVIDTIEPGEAAEIYQTWPRIAPTLMAKIKVPVQVILAGHEILWETGEVAAERLRSSFPQSSRTDLHIIADAGHCLDFHPASSGYFARIANFCESC